MLDYIRGVKIKYLNYLGYSVLSDNLSNNLEVKCVNNHIFKRHFTTFASGGVGCEQCHNENKIKTLQEKGFKVLSTNLSRGLEVECLQGHKFKRIFADFNTHTPTCPVCTALDNKKKLASIADMGTRSFQETC